MLFVGASAWPHKYQPTPSSGKELQVLNVGSSRGEWAVGGEGEEEGAADRAWE